MAKRGDSINSLISNKKTSISSIQTQKRQSLSSRLSFTTCEIDLEKTFHSMESG